MKKFTALIISLLTILPFIGIAWYLYSHFPSTPVAIINLLITMTGVMCAFIVYNRIVMGKDENAIKVDLESYPYIERALIYVLPADFISKLDKPVGKIFMASAGEVETKITLIEGNYNKLTDEIKLKFTNGVKLMVRGSATVAVGDNQFLFYGFEELIHTKGKEKYIFQWEDNRLVRKYNDEEINVKIPDRLPVYIFDWK